MWISKDFRMENFRLDFLILFLFFLAEDRRDSFDSNNGSGNWEFFKMKQFKSFLDTLIFEIVQIVLGNLPNHLKDDSRISESLVLRVVFSKTEPGFRNLAGY